MRSNTDKPKTGRRRFRGLEVAQAAILLVLGVVVAAVMYLTVSSMMASAPVPLVQLDPYNTILFGDWASVQLKFAKSVVVDHVDIIDNIPRVIATCTETNVVIRQGQEFIFHCNLNGATTWPTYMYVRLWLKDGSLIHVPWVNS